MIRSPLVSFLALAASVHLMPAADLTWDIQPGTAGAGDGLISGGAGTWSTALPNWTADNGTTNIPWDNTANAADQAVLSDGTGLITVNGTLYLAGLVVTSPVSSTIGGRTMGYLLNGGSLAFGTQAGVLDITAANTSLQVNSNLTGTAGLTLKSAGTDTGASPWITLNGDNTGLSGGIRVTSGLLAPTTQAAVGSNTLFLDNGGLFGAATHAGTGAASVTNTTALVLANNLQFTGTDNILRVWGGRSMELTGTLTGDGTARKADGGTLILSGNSPAFAGTLSLPSGTTGAITINSILGGKVEVAGGILTLNGTLPGQLDLTGGTAIVNAGGSLPGIVNLTTGLLDLRGTRTGDISYSSGSLAIRQGAVVTGNVTAAPGAEGLSVSAPVQGNLTINLDPATPAVFSGGSVTGNLATGDLAALTTVILNQRQTPVSIGGSLLVNGGLDLQTDGSIPTGSPLMTFSSLTVNGAVPGGAANNIKSSTLDTVRNGTLIFTPASILASYSPATALTWTGGMAAWEYNTSGGWTSAGNPDVFFNWDSVVFPDSAAGSVAIQPDIKPGDVLVENSAAPYTFTGSGLTGIGSFTKQGSAAVNFNQSAANTFPQGFNLVTGTVTQQANQQATGTGPLTAAPGTILTNFPLTTTATFTNGNSAISLDGATWNFGGSSGGTVTHTYNFTGGTLGSTSDTNPATAIQIKDSTLVLLSTNSTTKDFNGRIRWSGNNTINRTSSNFTHNTNWNRAWFGDGTVTINKTGTATGRAMTFNGAGSTFAGTVILNGVPATGGNDPTFTLTQPIGTAAFEVRNRWNLVNNSATGLSTTSSITLAGAASRLTLTQPVNNAALDLDLGSGTLALGNAASTIGTLTASTGRILSTGANAALTVFESAGSVFSGTMALPSGVTLPVSSTGLDLGEQTLGALNHQSGAVLVTLNATTPGAATLTGNYTGNGGTIRINVVGVPPSGEPVAALNWAGHTGPDPVVEVTGLGPSSRLSAAASITASGIFLTFTGNPANLVWTGNTDGLWDVNATTNWTQDGSPSKFFELDNALFNDTATGATTIQLDAPVNAGSVRFSHSTQDYFLTGSSGIAGAGQLTKNGTARLEISNTNTYSGGTLIQNGQLAASVNGALGSGTLTFEGGRLTVPSGNVTLANPVLLTNTATLGSELDAGNLTLAGPVTGSGGLTKEGNANLTLSSATNTFSGAVALNAGTLSLGAVSGTTGTGPLTIAPGTQLNGPALTGGSGTVTATFANSSITVNGGTLNLPGDSSGNVIHAYEFTGLAGSIDETNPATAIQFTDGVLTLASTANTTNKTFNGRIHWSGQNTINRTSASFTQSTVWNRAWYGSGTLTINHTGNATGRSMNFNGAGSTFAGTVILDLTDPSTHSSNGGLSDSPSFNLNQPPGTASFEIRNRWNLVNNVPAGLDQAASITLSQADSRLTLPFPIENPQLHLELAHGSLINTSGSASTVKSLTVNTIPMPPGTYTGGEATFLTGSGTVTVLQGPGAGTYDQWLAASGLTPGAPGTAPGESYDQSGVPNLLQFAMGGDVLDPSDNGIQSVYAQDGSTAPGLVLTVAVPSGAVFNGTPTPTGSVSGLTLSIQGSTGLGTWTDAVTEVPLQSAGGLTAPSGWMLKSFRLVETPALGSRGYLRLKASMP